MPCVNFEFLSPDATWPFRSKDARGTTNVPIRPRLSVTSADAAVWAATQDIGATRVLLYQCTDAVRAGSLRPILTEFEMEPVPVHLLHAWGSTLPTKTRVFLDFAVNRLRANLKSFG
jgi:DNA-binding transcriptional LysR family regulator